MKTDNILFSNRTNKPCSYIKKELNPSFFSDASKCCGKSYRYEMRETASNKLLGTMVATPVRKGRSRKENSYLYIDSLRVNNPNEGVGTNLMLLAEQESEILGCKGNIKLIASKCFSNKTPPHLFYRKMGYETSSKLINMLMDFCLKTKLKLSYLMPKNITMTKHIKLPK